MTRKNYKRRIGSGFQKVDQRLLMAGDVDVSLGSGDDKLYLYGNSVADNKYFHGGLGNDTLLAGGNNFNAFSFDYSF